MGMLTARYWLVLVPAFMSSAGGVERADAAGPQAAGATGERTWECIPSVIRADGIDAFVLEVGTSLNGGRVILDRVSARLLPPQPPPFALVDDGTGMDRLAGDGIYTAGLFRYRAGAPMPTHFWNDANSPSGLDIIEVGNVTIEPTYGSPTKFLLGPSIGILRPDIPALRSDPLSDTVAVTRHLINIRNDTRETQRALRDLPDDLPALTRQIYDLLPDTPQFLIFFSTHKLETPSAAVNFAAGKYRTVRVDSTGTGRVPQDDGALYGSGSALMGIILLDAGKRGLYAGNVTHEIMHQWGVYFDPVLGLNDAEGHFKARSNVGSLLGGQQWEPHSTGYFLLSCDKGRNGAYRASPMDRYLMGLTGAHEVPDVWLYSPGNDLPLERCGEAIQDVTSVVWMGDLLAAYGPRLPGPDASRRQFRLAFVAESHGRMLTATELAWYDLLAEHYTHPVPPGAPDPYVGFNWASIRRFFGEDTTWSSFIHRGHDFDADFDVDAKDFAHLRACLTGPGPAELPEDCRDADLDHDRDVDELDDYLLTLCESGPNVPFNPGCREWQDPPRLMWAVSRKMHGPGRIFDLPLLLSGSGFSVEPRQDGPTSLLFKFNRPLVPSDGVWDTELSISAGRLTALAAVSDTVVVELADVPDSHCLKASFAGLVDHMGVPLQGDTGVRFGVLLGDVNGDGQVASGDISLSRGASGQIVGAQNFRLDINLDGVLASGDISQVKKQSGRFVSCPPR